MWEVGRDVGREVGRDVGMGGMSECKPKTKWVGTGGPGMRAEK